jgi:hypothetical protein
LLTVVSVDETIFLNSPDRYSIFLFAVFADYAFIGNYVMYPIPDGFFNLLFVPATVRSVRSATVLCSRKMLMSRPTLIISNQYLSGYYKNNFNSKSRNLVVIVGSLALTETKPTVGEFYSLRLSLMYR